MARRRIGRAGGIRADLIARYTEEGEEWGEAIGRMNGSGITRNPWANLIEDLRAGKPVDMHGFQLARYFPGTGLAMVNRVRLERDDTVTVDPVEAPPLRSV